MNNKPTFIAEIGMNHNGNFDLCFEMIKQAKLSGADIVKFQLGWRDKPGEINQIDAKIINQLISWSKYFEIELLFSINYSGLFYSSFYLITINGLLSLFRFVEI